MALQLEELGDFEAAEVHYRRAYELMPDSFGRMESHCFGCEGVFRSNRAQGVAERVFMKLLETQPDKPQVHYLLGYLREQQGRRREALPLYQKAIELDPDYFNAWKHISALGDSMQLSPEIRDNVIINQIKLDPLGRHGSCEYCDNVWDLAQLWDALTVAHKMIEPLPESLLDMPGSAARIAEKKAAAEQVGINTGNNFSINLLLAKMKSLKDPGEVIAQNKVMAQISQLLQLIETVRGQGNAF